MEGFGTEEQRFRQGSFGGNPGQDVRRSMPQAGPAPQGLSQYTLPQASSSAPPGSWPLHPASGPPAPTIVSYERPPSAQAQAHSQAYGTYPPPRGDYVPPPSAPSYSRSESLSTPRRSPVEAGNPMQHQPMNGHPAEGAPNDFYGPGDYRGRSMYAPAEMSPNGKQPHAVQMSGGREAMPNPPSGPPPAPSQPPSQAPPQHPSAAYPTHPAPPHQVPAGPGNRVSPVGYDAPNYWPQVGMNSQPSFPRPRGHRAQHACENCRTRKAKCDEGKPSCGHCKENNLNCHYRDLQPQKQEKAGQAQIELLNAIHDKVQAWSQGMQELSTLSTLVQKHERELEKLRSRNLPRETPPQQVAHRTAMQRTFSAPNESPVIKTESKSFNEHVDSGRQTMTGRPHYGGGLIAAIDHTTAAQELLSWPSIKLLLQYKQEKDYVQQGEHDRGLIRLYGYGEGANRDDTGKVPASPAGSAISSNSDEQAGGSPDFAWGFDFQTNNDGPIPDDHPGGLTPDSKLRLDQELIDEYFDSYILHMYCLHPILDPRRLRLMIAKFKQLYSPQRLGALGKRKRDTEFRPKFQPDYVLQQRSEQDYVAPRYNKLERSTGNALILLIMALGKICNYREPLPGPVRHGPHSGSTSTPNSQPTFRSSSAISSMQNSPSLPQATPGQAYSVNHEHVGYRNMDVIPGLAYFTWAVGVLGEQIGGRDLEHCQAYLLASLYAGQLGHPQVSYGWIVLASQTCIGLIKRNGTLMVRMNEESRKNQPSRERIRVDLIETCYWTCLQLESDIRAELSQLQPSGIAEHEEWMDENQLMPTVNAIDNTNTPYTPAAINHYYLFQIYLRKELNKVHSEFYSPKNKHKITIDVISEWFDGFESYRNIFRDPYAWTDDQEPADDILTARLRAKFYGGRNIIIRPLLEAIIKDEFEAVRDRTLQEHDPASLPPGVHKSQLQSPGMPHVKGQTAAQRQHYAVKFKEHLEWSQTLRQVDIAPLTPVERTLAEVGIKSLICSTVAFDNVPGGRLVVTNIFGTYHAQFGNMLVLAAAYQSPRLREFVDRERLEELLLRTIRVLSDHKEISPTLSKDAEILEVIRKSLPSSLDPTESFSSHDS